MAVGGALDRPRRLAAPLPRRQRDDLVAAADLHRHRDHELLRRGRAARSRLGQQALDHADRRRLSWSARSPAPTCIGASPSASCSPSLLYILMTRTTFGFAARITGGNPRAALAQGLPVGRLIVACCADRRRLRRPRRLLRGRGDPGPAPTPRSSPATASPASSSPSSPATTRSPSSRSPSCSAASSAAGGLIQRRMGLPDATVLVLQGIIFVVLLASRDALRPLPDLPAGKRAETAS